MSTASSRYSRTARGGSLASESQAGAVRSIPPVPGLACHQDELPSAGPRRAQVRVAPRLRSSASPAVPGESRDDRGNGGLIWCAHVACVTPSCPAVTTGSRSCSPARAFPASWPGKALPLGGGPASATCDEPARLRRSLRGRCPRPDPRPYRHECKPAVQTPRQRLQSPKRRVRPPLKMTLSPA